MTTKHPKYPQQLGSSLSHWWYIPTHKLKISATTERQLALKGIDYIGELVQYSENDLIRFAGIGHKRLTEIKQCLNKRELSLGEQDIVSYRHG